MKTNIGSISSFINGVKFANKLNHLQSKIERLLAIKDDSLYSMDVAIVYTKRFTILSNGFDLNVVKRCSADKCVCQLVFWDKSNSTNYIVDVLGAFIDDDFSLDRIANLIGCSKDWKLIDKPKNVRIV